MQRLNVPVDILQVIFEYLVGENVYLGMLLHWEEHDAALGGGGGYRNQYFRSHYFHDGEKSMLFELTDKIRDSTAMVSAAIGDGTTIGAFRYASKRLHALKPVVIAAARHYGDFVLIDASADLQNDTEVLKAIVMKLCNLRFLFFPDRLPSIAKNREVVLLAVKKRGFNLMHAAEELRNDEEVVSAAIENDPSAIAFASERLQKLHCSLQPHLQLHLQRRKSLPKTRAEEAEDAEPLA